MVFGRGDSGSARLEQRHDEAMHAASVAAQQGRHDEALRRSAEALTIARELHERFPDDPRHRPVLAAALYNQAGRLGVHGRFEEALELLAEAAEHYGALAAAEPREHTVHRLDVEQRIARVLLLSGDVAGATERYRQVVGAYADAPTDDPVEGGLGLARAHFGLGRCLLPGGALAEALAELDAGLFAAEGVRESQGVDATSFDWLALAPPSFRLSAADWAAGAVCAMELHDAAGRVRIAADAANIAVRVTAGQAALGDPGAQLRYAAILARAQQIWEDAKHPMRAAADRAGPYGRVLVSGEQITMLSGGRPVDVPAVLRLAGWS